jgi:hypothetical protein
MGTNTTARYSTVSQAGLSFSSVFIPNFGIQADAFGNETSGYCLHGLYVMDLYVNKPSTGASATGFLFTSNGTTRSGISYSNIYGCRALTLCYGQCPYNTFFNSTQCVPCSSVIPNCAVCVSTTECSQCAAGGFVLSANSSNCECPARTYLDNTTTSCLPCPYDCYRCTSSGLCTSCSQTYDHRALDSNASRCVPMDGYFESGVVTASQCPSGCAKCISLTFCSACSYHYFLNNVTYLCYPCPFDCQTCDSVGYCITCPS